jgi:hypothetical protein
MLSRIRAELGWPVKFHWLKRIGLVCLVVDLVYGLSFMPFYLAVIASSPQAILVIVFAIALLVGEIYGFSRDRNWAYRLIISFGLMSFVGRLLSLSAHVGPGFSPASLLGVCEVAIALILLRRAKYVEAGAREG